MAQGIKFQILKFQHSNQLSKDAQLLTCQQRGRVRRPRRDRAAAQPHRLLSTPGKKTFTAKSRRATDILYIKSGIQGGLGCYLNLPPVAVFGLVNV